MMLPTAVDQSISQRVVVQSHDDDVSNCCGLDEGKARQDKASTLTTAGNEGTS